MADDPDDLTDNLTDDQKEKLLKILRKEEMAASNYNDSELMGTRIDAADYYDREPYGDEQEGSSKIVTSEFADTIESIMPSMMRVFAGNEAAVMFAPTGPGQEKAAQEATEYVPHVFFVKNEGYRILYWFIKDALMFRLSGATVDVEDYEETRSFPVEGIPQDALDLLAETAKQVGDEVEMEVEQDAGPPPAETGLAPGAVADIPPEQMMPTVMPGPTFSGTVTITKKARRVVADNIAPEDILFTPTAREQDKASYIGFRKKVSASELVELGLPWEDVQLLKSDRPISPEETQRNAAGIVTAPERAGDDDSERVLWVIVAYVRWAEKDDGKSKMWRVVYAHARGEISSLLEAQEWDGPASISLATPILMPHTIIGRSLFDQTKDLQEIGSVLTRGMLNNMYLVNTPRPVVSDQVNLDSLIDWVPGSPIRLKAGAKPQDNHVQWLQVPSVLAAAQASLEYFQTVRENRTGIVRNNQGLDADSLNKTASGMNMMMGAAMARMELIARTLAETAIKRLYRLVYRAIKRTAKGPTQYWTGQKMGTVDPSQWPDDMELTVNVGAGTRDQAMQGLAAIAMAQEKLILMQGGQASGPYVLPENVANVSQRVQETLGFRTPDLFFQSSEKVQQAAAAAAQNPPQPTPEQQALIAKTEVEKIRAQAEVHRSQTQSQIEASEAASAHEEAVAKVNADQAKMHADTQKAYAEMVSKNRELDLREKELALKEKQMEMDSYHKEQDRQLKERHATMQLAADHEKMQQGQFHDRQMARAKTEGGELDGLGDAVDPAGAAANSGSLADAIKGHVATQAEHAKALTQHMTGQADAMQKLAALHAHSTERMASAIHHLAEAHMAPQEIMRGPDGKVIGARRRVTNGTGRPT